VESKTGATTHLSGNMITKNATALKGPGTITSAKNNSVTGNAAQGVTPTAVNQQLGDELKLKLLICESHCDEIIS